MTTPANTGTQLAKKTEVHPTIALLQRDTTRAELSLVLPPGMDVDALISRAKLAILSKPDLLKCKPQSLLLAVKKSVASGLELDGRNAHLVPYGEEVQFIVDYKGYIALAKRSGIPLVFAELVFENDQFDMWTDDVGKHLIHKPNVKNRGELLGVYSFTKTEGGVIDFEYLTLPEVEAVRERSKAKNNGPWKTDYNEMVKKTAIRRHSKRWDIAPQFRAALEDDDDKVIETTATVVRRSPSFGNALLGKGAGEVMQAASDEAAAEPAQEPAAPAGRGPRRTPAAAPTEPPIERATQAQGLENLCRGCKVTVAEVMTHLNARDIVNCAEVDEIPAEKFKWIVENFATIVADIRGE